MTLAKLLQQAGSTPDRRQNRIYGVVTAIVMDIRDPQEQGRVKVNFPWLGDAADAVSVDGEDDRAHSYWARISSPMAGGGRGMYFVPEVGDEVLVAFEHGQLDRPVVLGMLWNGDDAPPESMDAEGSNDIRSITSRSGHRIVLNDSGDEPGILIEDSSGENRIYIDTSNNAIEITASGDLNLTAGGNLSISVGGDLTLEVSGKATVDTGTDLAMSSGANGKWETGAELALKAGTNMQAEGAVQATLKGGASAAVEGSGMAKLKGAIVMIN